jgi:hypothetical protein
VLHKAGTHERRVLSVAGRPCNAPSNAADEPRAPAYFAAGDSYPRRGPLTGDEVSSVPLPDPAVTLVATSRARSGLGPSPELRLKLMLARVGWEVSVSRVTGVQRSRRFFSRRAAGPTRVLWA